MWSFKTVASFALIFLLINNHLKGSSIELGFDVKEAKLE